ncbi:MAG: hypothetical protein ACRCW3_02410, partial [Metamycoplasmataceae bacterium]
MIFGQRVKKLWAKIAIFCISGPVGGAVSKLCMLPQDMLVLTCSKFGMNTIKRCGDIALRLFLQVLHKMCLHVYQKQFYESTWMQIVSRIRFYGLP